jgi:uncharacterized protein YjbJ (UPF0337 family)
MKMVETSRTKKSATKAATHAKHAAEVAKGKVKTAAGMATGNKTLEVKGQLDKVKGRAKQAGQRIKESLEE